VVSIEMRLSNMQTRDVHICRTFVRSPRSGPNLDEGRQAATIRYLITDREDKRWTIEPTYLFWSMAWATTCFNRPALVFPNQ